MPSGKRARQQRQAAAAAVPPPVRSKGVGGARARQASPRALGIAGAVVLLVVIAIVLAVVLGRGGGSASSGTVSAADLHGLPAVGNQNWPGALQGAGEANDLFKGIPQNGLILGSPQAPVEMEMFIDVQCPVCQNYETTYLPTVVRQYIRTGKVQLHLQPWAFLGGAGSQSFSGRYGVIAAGAQNKAFQYAKVLYDNQGPEESGWLDGQMMANIAASVTGLRLDAWRADTNSSGARAVAAKVDKLAAKVGVTGTPTILVGCTGGKLHDIVGPTVAPNLQDTEQALNAAQSACGK
ncbi:MAG TPA: thioredoxin domain-containing protein [Gaiellaceae bacterium]|nr:thioredoxin domain-containing protein [Gaiellaceae bacterium]